MFKISKDVMTAIKEEAVSISNKSNIKKYKFDPKDIECILKRIYTDKKGKVDLKELVKFAASYCDENDRDYPMVSTIIKLSKRHLPKYSIVGDHYHGKKIIIIGDAAQELFSKATLDWEGSHVSTAGAKIPLQISTKSKMKCFGGERICDTMDEIVSRKQKKDAIEFKRKQKAKERNKELRIKAIKASKARKGKK